MASRLAEANVELSRLRESLLTEALESASLRSTVVTMRKALLLVAKLELSDKSLSEMSEGDAHRAMRAVRAALKGGTNG